jgi:sigma-E factor negative regulatory protein RseB
LLEVRARDAFRYSYRLWLEKSSGLLVRSMLLGVDQRPLQQFMFVALDIGATPSEADLTPSVAASGASTEAASPAEVSVTPASQWSVSDAPVGFALTARRQPFDGKNGSVEHLVFSDGLASVSVYLEPVATVPGLLTKGLVSRGALSVYARSFNGFQVTVLGEVPPVTVERIAQSLHQGEQSSGK